MVPPSHYIDNIKVSLRKYAELSKSNNDIMKNIVREEVISEVQISHPFFRKVNPHLT